MEIALVVVVLALLAVLAWQVSAARAAAGRAEATEASLRAEVVAAGERAEEADAGRRRLEAALATESEARAAAVKARAQLEEAANRRLGEVVAARAQVERQLAAANRALDSARSAAGSARAEAEVARRELDGARAEAERAREEARAEVEAAERRVAEAAQALRLVESGASTSATVNLDTEHALARVAAAGADDALATALWESDLAAADRAWRMFVAPMPAESLLGRATGEALTAAVAQELERLREEVGVATELDGRVAVEPNPLVAVVALRAARDLVAETARCCNSVDVTLADGDGVDLTVTGEGWDGSTPAMGTVGALVAVVAGTMATAAGDGGRLRTEIRLPVAARVAP